MNSTNRIRKLRSPRPCRYCGHVADDHRHERLPGNFGPPYSCRDVDACGARIRENDRAAGGPEVVSEDLPF